MAGSNRIDQTVDSFDPLHLVQLALKPLMQLLSEACVSNDLHASGLPTPKTPDVTVRVLRTKKPAAVKTPKNLHEPVKMDGDKLKEDAILIPTLMGAAPMTPTRRKAANAASSLKVAHG